MIYTHVIDWGRKGVVSPVDDCKRKLLCLRRKPLNKKEGEINEHENNLLCGA